MVGDSGLQDTKGVLKAGWSDLNPHRGANIIAGGAQRSSPHRVAVPHKPSKGAVIKRCYALSRPGASSILTCALLLAIILRPLRIPSNF